MKTKMVQRTPTFSAVVLVLLVVAACAIRLHGGGEQTNKPVSADLTFVPLLPKLTECRSVTNEGGPSGLLVVRCPEGREPSAI